MDGHVFWRVSDGQGIHAKRQKCRDHIAGSYNQIEHLYCGKKSANICCFACWFEFKVDSRLIQSNKKVKSETSIN